MNPLDFLLGKTKPSSRGSVPGFPPAPRGRFPSSWGAPKVPVSAMPKGGAGLLGPVGTLVDLAYTVPKVFNPNDNIITSLQNLGTSIQNQFSTQTRGYVGSSPTAVAANQRRYRGVIGSIPPSADGESYRRAELRLADAARPGGGGGGGGNAGYSVNTSTGRSGMGSPEDRAYQSAKAETAAMVATDPLMQQWSAAQKAKDYTTADQLGKQIWQNKYGGGLMGQPGGVIGSRNPLMERTFGYQTGMSPGDISQTITNPAAVPVGPGEAPYQVGDLGTGALGETGYDPVRYGVDVEEIKKRLLQQAAAK